MGEGCIGAGPIGLETTASLAGAGLDVTCRTLARSFERIVYVSCNPQTLARDVQELLATHTVTRLAAFDQFAYTPHLECGVVLERRDSRGADRQ